MPLPFAPLGGARRPGARLPFSAPLSPVSPQRLAAAGSTEFADMADAEASTIANQQRSQKMAFDMEQDVRNERQQRRNARLKQEQDAAERLASIDVAKAEFGLATAPKTITDSERNRLEEDFTKTRSQIQAEAAAALAADTLADPVANETEGGFLGFGAQPTAAALEKQKAAERFQDPANLTDADLETYRAKNPASFAKFDELRTKLDTDQKARDSRSKAEFGVALAKARKSGFDPLAGMQPDEDPVAALDRVQGEVETMQPRIAELQAKARSGLPLGEMQPLLEELGTLQNDFTRKTQFLETGRAAINAQRRAAQVSEQATRENAVKGPTIATVSPEAAKTAALTLPDGSYETTQPENLAALAKDGAKVFWKQDGAKSTATPESRAAKIAEAAQTIADVKTAAQEITAKTATERDRLQGLVNQGLMTPEHANAALDALVEQDLEDSESAAAITNRKLLAAKDDFLDGQIDAKTLDSILHAAGSPSTAAEVVAEATKQRKVEDEHVAALKTKIEGDPNDPVLSGESLNLSKKIRDIENPGFLKKWGGYLKATPMGMGISAIVDTIGAVDWLMDPSLWGKQEAEKAAILKTRLADMRQQSKDMLAKELTSRGVDLADQPRLIARAQLEAERDSGIMEVVASRGGAAQAVGEKLPFVGAILEADRLLPFAETAYKLQAGEQVDADEMEAFSEFMRFAGNDQAFLTKVTDTVTALPAYVVELASTSGVASAVRTGGMKVLKEAIMAAATKEGKERLVKASAEAVAKKFGKDHAKKYAAWRIGSGLAQEAVRLPVASGARIAAGFNRDAATDGVQLSAGEQGIVAMMDREGRKGNWERFAASTVDSLIENVSERSGGYLAKLIPAGVRDSVAKMSQQAKGKLLSAALVKSLVAANPNKPVGQIGKFLKGANIGGTFEEMGEERIGSLLRDIYTGATTGEWELTLPSAEDLAVELAAFTVPNAARGIQTNRHFSKLDNSLRASDSEFTARLDSLYQSPEAEADRITEKIGTPVEADDLTNATALVGQFENADAVKAVDRLSLDLMERSEKALASGDLEKASRLRQRALQVNRSKGDLLDDEVIRAVGATKEIAGIRDAAMQTRAQVEAMLDADPGKKQALAQVEKMEREADLAGALVKIAQGREGVMTAAEQEAIKPVKGTKPAVVQENGAFIITDDGIAKLRSIAPTAATYIKDGETVRRQKLLSQSTPAQQPPASSPAAGAPVVGGSSPQAGAAPTASSGAGVAEGAATAPPAVAAPATFQSVPAGQGTVSVDPDGSIRVRWKNSDVDTAALIQEATAKGLIPTISGTSGTGANTTSEMVFAQSGSPTSTTVPSQTQSGKSQPAKQPKESESSSTSPTSSKPATSPAADKPKTAREWRNDTRKRLVDKIRDPKTKAKVSRVVDAVGDALEKRGNPPPGGIVTTEQKGGSGVSYNPTTKAIEVNVRLLTSQVNDEKAGALDDTKLADWMDRIASEEMTHFATVEAISFEEAAAAWRKLGKSKAGKQLQSDSMRAYNAAYEQAGKQAPALDDAAAYYELIRMAIQNTEFRQRITEASFAEPGIKADLLAFLQRIADILTQRIAALPKAARAALEGDLAKVKASMDALGIVTDSGKQAPAEVVVGQQPSSDTGTPAADPGQAAAGTSNIKGDSNLTLVKLRDGRLVRIRTKELNEGKGEIVRAFTPEGKPIKGDAGAIPRNLIVVGAVAQPASTENSDSLSQAASAVYQSILDKYPPPNDNVGEWHKQLAIQVENPGRFHPVVQEPNEKNIVIGDTVSVPLLDGVRVVSVGRQGAKMMVKIAPMMPGVYGGWYDIDKVTKQDAAPVDVAANEAATSPANDKPQPTDAQKKAGNYEMGHVKIGGMDITIENPAGSVRSGTDKDGERWEVTMKSHYGYLKGTKGKDGDHIDIFIEEGTPEDYSGPVYVVNQINQDGEFDEHKAVMGQSIKNAAQARAAYLANYSPGWSGDGSIAYFPNVDLFKKWASASQRRAPAKTPIMDWKYPEAAEKKPTKAGLAKPTIDPGKHYLFDTKAGDVATRGTSGNIFIIGHFSKMKDAEAVRDEMSKEMGVGGIVVLEPWLRKSNREGGKPVSMWSVFIPNVDQEFVDAFNAAKKADTETVNPAPSSTPAPESTGVADAPKADTRPATPDRDAQQKAFIGFKRALQKAINAKDWQKVIEEADRFDAYYSSGDNGPFPDDWARWERAKEDAQQQLRITPPLVVPITRPLVSTPPAVSEAEQKAADAMRENLKGLFAASRPVASPFFSQLAETVRAKMPASATPEMVRGIIMNPQNRIKQEELKWSGVLPWLDQQGGKVSRDRLLTFLENEGAVELKEVSTDDYREGMIRMETESVPFAKAKGKSAELLDAMYDSPEREWEILDAIDNGQTSGDGWSVEWDRKSAGEYAQYQLPGGENYREVVLAMPKVGSLKVYDTANGNTIKDGFETFTEAQTYIRENALTGVNIEPIPAQNYTSTHFPNVPNYVAHMRLNERTDATGAPGLFVEELQSDRHQKGRSDGYGETFAVVTPRPLMEGGGTKEVAAFDSRDEADTYVSQNRSPLNQLQVVPKSGIPDAPFRKDWPLALFKRALRDAVATGKDWIGWTTGDTQAERYDLSKQVDEIWVRKLFGNQGWMVTAIKNGDEVINQPATDEAALAQIIGKELARKAITDQPNPGVSKYSGLDLKVGGEGMKGFYDSILPKEISKYVKQWGGKVEKGKIDNGDPLYRDFEEFAFELNNTPFKNQTQEQLRFAREMWDSRTDTGEKSFPIWRVNITPAMREGVQRGQPLFSAPRPDAEWRDEDIPEDRIPGIMQTTKLVIDAGVRTPEDFAAFMERTFPGGGSRPFVSGIWQIMGGMRKELRTATIPDWAGIYAKLDAPKAPTEEADMTPVESYTKTVAKAVRDSMLAGEPFTKSDRDSALMLAEQLAPGFTKKDMDEAMELGVTMAARRIVASGNGRGDTPDQIFQRLKELYDLQPKLSAKTSTSKINQAFSTPAPMAYVGSRLADIQGGKVIEERTAGNGMLLIERSPSQTILANEIDPKRAARLRMQGINPTMEDGTTWTPAQTPDRVIANPPFGQVMEEGTGANIRFQTPMGETTSIDHAIVLQSLATMAPDGRAVFIIGGPPPTVRDPKARAEYYRTGRKGDFFAHLYKNYRVIDHFTVSGDLYEKQGAGWPVDFLVVAGAGRSPISLPGRKAPRMIGSWEELGNEINRTDTQRIEQNRLTEAEVQRDVDELVNGLGQLQGPIGGGRNPATAGGNDAQPSDAPTNTEGSGGIRDAGQSQGTGGRDSASSQSDRPGRVSAADDAAQQATETGGTGSVQGDRNEPQTGNGDTRVNAEAVASEFQSPYSPVATDAPSFELLAPMNLVTPMSEALNRLRQKVGPLTDYVRDKLGYPKNTDIGKFYAAEQIDALAQAIYQSENGGALVVGDQTGVGKGRVVAGLMKYALKQGKTPVFFTKDPTLYNAMLDDLQDVGAGEVLPMITNNDFGSEYKDFKKRLKDARIFSGKEAFEEYLSTGVMPGGANAVFTSYSQISSDDAPGLTKAERAQARANGEPPPSAWRMAALNRLASNSLVILDESHLASGQSTTGWRLAEILGAASQVYYSSATFAKRPDNMGLYFRTSLGQVGGDLGGVISLMQSGGVPAMQVASSMLADEGQYMRRERSFAGVRFGTTIMTETFDRDRELADNYTDGLRMIVQVQDRASKMATMVNQVVAAAGSKWGVPPGNRMRLESMNFSAKLHNMVRQYLLAIKAGAASKMAIRAIRDGVADGSGNVRSHKVIVTVENTMESAIINLRNGGYPLTFNGMLRMYLDQQREFVVRAGSFGRSPETWTLPRTGNPEYKDMEDRDLQQIVTVRGVDAEGNPTVDIRDDVLKEMLWRAMNNVFVQAEQEIEELQLADMPVSPIDAMRQEVERAGIRTGEMTAREVGIDSNGEVYYRTGESRMDAMTAFNNSDLHFLVINKSGSTGVSMHASEKFKDRRPRLMLVVQPNLDINEFMQTIGRIHRSGQVEKPSYDLLQTALPAEKRPAAILGAKMAMLNANTTSNADSEVSNREGVDLFNKYGDEVVHAYLANNRGLVRMIDMSWPGKLTDKDGNLHPLAHFQAAEEGGGDGYLSRSVTGHLAILPVDEQEAFWERVEADYQALIEYQEAIGQNELRAKVMDLKANTIKKDVFTPGNSSVDSVFAAPSYMETVETTLGRKPMSAEEVTKLAADLRAGGRAKAIQDYITKADAFIDAQDKIKAVRQNKWDEKRDEWLRQQRAARDLVASAIGQVGTFGVYKRQDGTQGWAMIEDVVINDDKPVTPSAHRAKVLVNDSNYQFPITLTKLGEFFEARTFGERQGWQDTYDFGSTRTIITGNLLGALAATSGRGQIINYSTATGENRMGILMPGAFTKEQDEREKNRESVTTADQAIEKMGQGLTVINQIGSIRLYKKSDGNGYTLAVPATRSAGGKYWRDPALNRMTLDGEFMEASGTMYGDIASSRIGDVFTYLADKEPLFAISPLNNKGDSLQSAPRLGIDDPDFIEALDFLNEQLPSETEREDLLNRAGFNWNRTFTDDELRQAASGVRVGLRSEYDERRDRQTHEGWNAEAVEMLRNNRQGVIRDLVATAAAGEAIINPVQVKASQLLLSSLTMRALAAGDRQAMRDAEALTWAYDIAGTETARGLAARWQPHKTPEELHRELIAKAIFTPSKADRDRAAKAPTPSGKRRRIAELEAEIERVKAEAIASERNILQQASDMLNQANRSANTMTAEMRKELNRIRRETTQELATLREQLQNLQDQKDSLQILAEANDKRLKQIEEAFKEMGVTFHDLFISKEAVVALRTSSMVKNVLGQFNEKERLVTKMRMEAKTDRHIAKKLNISKTAVEAINERFNVAFRAQAREWVKRGFSAADLDGSVDIATLIDEKGNLLSSARPTLTDAEIDAKVDEIFRVIVPSEEARATGALKRVPGGPKEGEFGFDLSRPEHAAMLMRAIQRLDATGMDMVYEYWINGLLSGPATHMANLAGNVGNAAWEYSVQRPVEMLVNSIVTRDAAGAQFDEVKSMAKYLGLAASTAIRYARIVWNTEVSLFDPQWLNKPVSIGTTSGDKGQVQRFAIKGKKGQVVRIPSRALSFADEFAKHLFGMLEAAAQAHRLAKAEGLKGAEFDARVDRLVKTPGSPAWIAAVDKAHAITFTSELPAPLQKMQDALHDRAKTPWGAVIKTFLRFLFPFVRTPYNIFATGLRKTPLGGLRMIGKGIAAYRGNEPFFDSYPKAAMAADIAEQLLAWTATMMLIGIAEGDPDDDEKTLLITGSRSLADNRGEDQMLSRMKGGENTIVWKGKPIFHYGRYEPFSTVITTVVDAARNMKAMGQGRSPKEAFDQTWRGFLNQARSKTFLQGLEGLMSLIEGHKNLTDSAVKAVAQGVVPNLIRQPVRAVDDFARDSRNAPWYYHAFPAGGLAEPLYDLYGRPIEKAGSPVTRALVSVPTKQAPIVPADRAMSRFNLENPLDAYYPQQPNKSMFRYKVPVPGLDAKGKPKFEYKDMTPQEAAAFRKRAGQQFAAEATLTFPFGAGTATPLQMEDIKAKRDRVQRETKETMFPGRAPAMPPRKAPTLAELFGQRLRQ